MAGCAYGVTLPCSQLRTLVAVLATPTLTRPWHVCDHSALIRKCTTSGNTSDDTDPGDNSGVPACFDDFDEDSTPPGTTACHNAFYTFFFFFFLFSFPPHFLHRCSLECAVRDGKPSGVTNARPPTTSRCCMRQLERSTANLRYIITHHRKLRPLSPKGKYCQGHSTATARDLTKKIAVGNMSWTFCVSTLPSALCNPFPQKARKIERGEFLHPNNTLWHARNRTTAYLSAEESRLDWPYASAR